MVSVDRLQGVIPCSCNERGGAHETIFTSNQRSRRQTWQDFACNQLMTKLLNLVTMVTHSRDGWCDSLHLVTYCETLSPIQS